MTPDVVCAGRFFVNLSLTSSQIYIHEELAPARIKEDIKAVGKMVDLLDDVFPNLYGKKIQRSRACSQVSK